MNFQNLSNAFFSWHKPIECLKSLSMLEILIVVLCLYGCGHASKSTHDTEHMQLNELNNVFKLNNRTADGSLPQSRYITLKSLIGKFGDIPQVHTYHALKQRMHTDEPLTIDEIIAFAAADLYLFPSKTKAETLEKLKTALIPFKSAKFSDPVLTYKVRIDRKYGDGIEVHYPDGSKKISDTPRHRNTRGRDETIISIWETHRRKTEQ